MEYACHAIAGVQHVAMDGRLPTETIVSAIEVRIGAECFYASDENLKWLLLKVSMLFMSNTMTVNVSLFEFKRHFVDITYIS